MMDRIRALLLRLMKVPPEPEPPAGAPESIQVFRAGRNYYRLLLVQWAFGQAFAVIAILALLLGGFVNFKPEWLLKAFHALEWFGLASLIAQMPFTYLLVKLNYELRWYVVTDRSLRIRHGLQSVRELTMTFANIQQIVVHQGPLQRLLGVADVEVRTAGGGAGAEAGHHGHEEAGHIAFFHGVDNAEEIRDLILARMKRLRDTGLGDTDESHDEQPATSADVNPLVEAAREMLGEVRAMRNSVA
jgi:membrane protein YdbS with pleckstrin-like domain